MFISQIYQYFQSFKAHAIHTTNTYVYKHTSETKQHDIIIIIFEIITYFADIQ